MTNNVAPWRFNRIDNSLKSWSEIADPFQNAGILLGNGFSCAVWEKFRYSSLYDWACSKIPNPLSIQDRCCFEGLKTNNFELVLSDLSKTDKINTALEIQHPRVRERYEHIKNALGESVRSVHIPYYWVPEDVLAHIRQELIKYNFVYSTNYDLLIYWSVMSQDEGQGFKDYFWSTSNGKPVFDIIDTQIYGDPTLVLYLHGALHIYRNEFGQTQKLCNGQGKNILENFDNPLFITEGSSEDKLRAIRQSDYLTFAYNKFMNHEKNLVIFGHSLGNMDCHLLEAIKNICKKNNSLKIAISIYCQGKSPEDIEAQTANLRADICQGLKNWQKPTLMFFDSQTHPLGSPEIAIECDESFLALEEIF